MEVRNATAALEIPDIFVGGVCGGVDDGMCRGTHFRRYVKTAGATSDDEDDVAKVVWASVVSSMCCFPGADPLSDTWDVMVSRNVVMAIADNNEVERERF